jgi:hypothetical protein
VALALLAVGVVVDETLAVVALAAVLAWTDFFLVVAAAAVETGTQRATPRSVETSRATIGRLKRTKPPEI